VLTQVGDRQVMKAMQAQQAVLGGEESGHFIFANHHTTGDGILSGLQLLAAIQLLGKPLSELSGLMTVFPQTLINVPVGLKPDISEVPELTRVIEEVSQQLGDRGRVLVRYSGTEPLCRIMVEGQEPADIEQYAGRIADVVSRGLGPKKAP
jgi:phosphoglucosamine mutase